MSDVLEGKFVKVLVENVESKDYLDRLQNEELGYSQLFHEQYCSPRRMEEDIESICKNIVEDFKQYGEMHVIVHYQYRRLGEDWQNSEFEIFIEEDGEARFDI